MHGRKVFLPVKLYGQGRIHHDPDYNDTTRTCRKIKSRRKSTQWIHICKGYNFPKLSDGVEDKANN